MSKVKVMTDDKEVREVEVKILPLTIKRVRELQKLEKEGDQLDVLKHFVDNCLEFEQAVEFDYLDTISLAELVNKEFNQKLELSGK